LDSLIALYEKDRVTDFKALLLHFIHAEMGYHATALETLSNLYRDINARNPREDMPVSIDVNSEIP
jgi:hypothetical protein